MNAYKKNVLETTEFIRKKIQHLPDTCIMTGTGLGNIAESTEISTSFDYETIPNFPVSTIKSHHGNLLFGKLKGKNVVIMQGRFHLYEGYSPLEVTFPIRVMQTLGVKNLIVTNASGGLNLSYKEGDIMVIADHINLTGKSPLTGPNEDSWGLRFPDMIHAYDKNFQKIVQQFAEENRIPIQNGVYAGLPGPSLETPAEMRYLKTIGADTVGFSTIQEVIAAVHAGMRILGLSIITNINDPDHPVPATMEGVIDVANKTAPNVDKLIAAVMEEI